jgi:hypothetical protein
VRPVFEDAPRVGFARYVHRDERACVVSVSDVLCDSKKKIITGMYVPSLYCVIRKKVITCMYVPSIVSSN